MRSDFLTPALGVLFVITSRRNGERPFEREGSDDGNVSGDRRRAATE